MIALQRPTPAEVNAYLSRLRDAPFSYREVGASRGESAPAGYVVDHRRILVGVGGQAFAAARACLRRWEMFRLGWVSLWRPGTPVEPGAVVATLARLVGTWWLNPCRIVYVEDEARRFRFAYGTLAGHVETGEERFTVEWLDDDTVWYDLYAFSRPGHWLTRAGYPAARMLQKRFGVGSMHAFLRAVRRELTHRPREVIA